MRRTALLLAVLGLAGPPVAAEAAVAPTRPISSDTFTNPTGQHATEVEPDSFSFGNTVVAAFQVGRFEDGGATTIGWATSRDGGRTWTSGFLPSLTVYSTPAGALTRVSDPAVAYDRVHGVWLISMLGLRDAPGSDLVSSLVVSRSADGLEWSAPVVTSPELGSFVHDKNWVVCDNGATSRFAGRCYVTWTDVPSRESLAVSTTLDGGLTWGAPVLVRDRQTGSQPVVRPDGTLVVVYWSGNRLASTRSTSGGASFEPPTRIATFAASRPSGMRAPPLPSAEVDAAGRVYVAWHDCTARLGCPQAAPPNDIVLSSSPDGRGWAEPAVVPGGQATLTRFLPGLGVDVTRAGATARLAIAYYTLSPSGCEATTCRLTAWLVRSETGGRSWGAPLRLGSPVAISALADSDRGRFVGDYISTSFVGAGVAVPVFSIATAPFDGAFHQSIFAATVPAAQPPSRVSLGGASLTPARPRVGGRFEVNVSVRGAPRSARVACTARVANGRSLGLLRSRLAGGRATCAWRLPALARGRRVTGAVILSHAGGRVSQRFSFPVAP